MTDNGIGVLSGNNKKNANIGIICSARIPNID
jgi:hypothetical protein